MSVRPPSAASQAAADKPPEGVVHVLRRLLYSSIVPAVVVPCLRCTGIQQAAVAVAFELCWHACGRGLGSRSEFHSFKLLKQSDRCGMALHGFFTHVLLRANVCTMWSALYICMHVVHQASVASSLSCNLAIEQGKSF